MLLSDPPASWPEIEVELTVGSGTGEPTAIGAEHAHVRTVVGEIEIDRAARRAEYRTTRPLADDEVAHPFLLPVAGVFSMWDGNLPLHGGAFVSGGGAWAVLGHKEAGKSTLMALIALAGATVVADDMVVIDASGSVLAGPRGIDLRPESAERLGAETREVRRGERRRLELPPVEHSVPLAGLVTLEWGDGPAIEPLPPSERATAATAYRTLGLPVAEPRSVLDLAGLPGLRLRRPRDWSGQDDAVRLLLEATESQGG
jgi:hypothetical protein